MKKLPIFTRLKRIIFSLITILAGNKMIKMIEQSIDMNKYR